MGIVTKEALDLESYAASVEDAAPTAPVVTEAADKTDAPTTEAKE